MQTNVIDVKLFYCEIKMMESKKMNEVILVRVNVHSFLSNAKADAAQNKINEYIKKNYLNVICVSLFKESEDDYLFTLTVKRS